jgi:hypothetical protein
MWRGVSGGQQMMSEAAQQAFDDFCDAPGEPMDPADIVDFAFRVLGVGISKLSPGIREQTLDGLEPAMRRFVKQFVALSERDDARLPSAVPGLLN